MAYMFGALSTAKLFDVHRVRDDFCDRLHYIVTTMSLITCSVTIAFKQFMGRPIECALTGVIEDSDEQWVENYCWSKNTYFIPWEDDIPIDIAERRKKELAYYQFVPFFLMVQALTFQVPFHFWKATGNHTGIRVTMLVNEALDPRNLDMDQRRKTVRTLRRHLENSFRFHKRIYRSNLMRTPLLLPCQWSYTSCYVSTMFLFAKLLYLANAFLQFRLLNWFMIPADLRYSYFGIGALMDMLNGTEWAHSGMFPRMTICDFEIRKLGQLQHFSVQCVLSINAMNEKIFIFYWLWYLLLTFTSAYSFMQWAVSIMTPWCQRNFIIKQLELADMTFDYKKSNSDLKKFVFNYLHTDGVFILSMISQHAGAMMASDVTAALWKSFYNVDSENALKDIIITQPNIATCNDSNQLYNQMRNNYVWNRYKNHSTVDNEKGSCDMLLHVPTITVQGDNVTTWRSNSCLSNQNSVEEDRHTLHDDSDPEDEDANDGHKSGCATPSAFDSNNKRMKDSALVMTSALQRAAALNKANAIGRANMVARSALTRR